MASIDRSGRFYLSKSFFLGIATHYQHGSSQDRTPVETLVAVSYHSGFVFCTFTHSGPCLLHTEESNSSFVVHRHIYALNSWRKPDTAIARCTSNSRNLSPDVKVGWAGNMESFNIPSTHFGLGGLNASKKKKPVSTESRCNMLALLTNMYFQVSGQQIDRSSGTKW